jgi:hypothetical protein
LLRKTAGEGIEPERMNVTCAGYLAYPFQNQEANSREEDIIATNLMRECKGKELVKPS